MTKYPPGGSRENVSKLMRSLGFSVGKQSDKLWVKPQCSVQIWGTGSMALVRTDTGTFECPLDDLVTRLESL